MIVSNACPQTTEPEHIACIVADMLIADIGGSNGRIAILNNGKIEQERVFPCADFDSIESLLSHYFSVTGAQVTKAVIAVASAVVSDDVVFTNMNWRFRISDLGKQFKFRQFKVLNDFAALAMAIPALKPHQIRKVEGGQSTDTAIRERAAKAVIGPGTGLGVSGLLPVVSSQNGCIVRSWAPIQGEGGHVRYAPQCGPGGDLERAVLSVIAQKGDYVSAESLLCGSGLLKLYHALTTVRGVESNCDTPAQVVATGITSEDQHCRDTLDLYIGILGDVAGDLALILNAGGGVYIGGGIVNHMADFFCQSIIFRQRFEDKGEQSKMLKTTPVFLVCDTNAALYGAALALNSEYSGIGIGLDHL